MELLPGFRSAGRRSSCSDHGCKWRKLHRQPGHRAMLLGDGVRDIRGRYSNSSGIGAVSQDAKWSHGRRGRRGFSHLLCFGDSGKLPVALSDWHWNPHGPGPNRQRNNQWNRPRCRDCTRNTHARCRQASGSNRESGSYSQLSRYSRQTEGNHHDLCLRTRSVQDLRRRWRRVSLRATCAACRRHSGIPSATFAQPCNSRAWYPVWWVSGRSMSTFPILPAWRRKLGFASYPTASTARIKLSFSSRPSKHRTYAIGSCSIHWSRISRTIRWDSLAAPPACAAQSQKPISDCRIFLPARNGGGVATSPAAPASE